MRRGRQTRNYTGEEIKNFLGNLVPVGRFHEVTCPDTGGSEFRYTASKRDRLYEIVVKDPYSSGFLSGPRAGKKRDNLGDSYAFITFNLDEKDRLNELSLAEIMRNIPDARKRIKSAFETILLEDGNVQIRFYRENK